MDEIKKQESVSQFNNIRGQETLHPLVTVLNQSKSKPVPAARFYSGLYIIFLKDIICGEMSYGRNNYDYQEGTLVFISPGQVWGTEEKMKTIQPKGWALAFHPEGHFSRVFKNETGHTTSGATGYIAQRLLPVLLNSGHYVVCCVRDKKRFDSNKYQRFCF